MELLPVVDASHLFNGFAEISAVLYSILVAVGYLTEGPRFQFRFDARFPIYSTQRLLVGMGVRTLAWGLRLAGHLMAPLYEASAEIGEWVALRTSVKTQTRFRSRFI